jgi:hypothetical protein
LRNPASLPTTTWIRPSGMYHNDGTSSHADAHHEGSLMLAESRDELCNKVLRHEASHRARYDMWPEKHARASVEASMIDWCSNTALPVLQHPSWGCCSTGSTPSGPCGFAAEYVRCQRQRAVAARVLCITTCIPVSDCPLVEPYCDKIRWRPNLRLHPLSFQSMFTTRGLRVIQSC